MKYLLLAFILLIAQIVCEGEKVAKHKGCLDEHPNLSVGDMLNDSNFYDFKKKNKVYILGVSDSKCESCCTDEPLLAFLKKAMDDGIYSYKKKPIPVVRLDIA